ncbi:MAG: hypothetical protein ACK56F_06630, partial [bacterium]
MRLTVVRVLSVAFMDLPPLFRGHFLVELGQLLSMNTNSDCSVLLSKIINIAFFPLSSYMTLSASSNSFRLVSLPKECALA